MSRTRKFCSHPDTISRREFARQMSVGAAGLAFLRHQDPDRNSTVPLALVKGASRRTALKSAWQTFERTDFRGKDLYIKGSFNSPDPYPSTTHPETLEGIVEILRAAECGRIILVERSGMGPTRSILERLGITGLARRLGIEILALEELSAEQWRQEPLSESHWETGIQIPKWLDLNTSIVQICNLKTHRFGAVFSASLKNSLGLIAKRGTGIQSNHNYMKELHASPHQGSMIAEVNRTYRPMLVFMDAMQVFVDGGPEKGDLASPSAFAVSRDRIAVDATGVALLRLEGAGEALGGLGVFEQEQIKRAAELNLGIKAGREIRFVTADEESRILATQLTAHMLEILEEGG